MARCYSCRTRGTLWPRSVPGRGVQKFCDSCKDLWGSNEGTGRRAPKPVAWQRRR
jgi:hypothetical protein